MPKGAGTRESRKLEAAAYLVKYFLDNGAFPERDSLGDFWGLKALDVVDVWIDAEAQVLALGAPVADMPDDWQPPGGPLFTDAG